MFPTTRFVREIDITPIRKYVYGICFHTTRPLTRLLTNFEKPVKRAFERPFEGLSGAF